MARTKTTKLKEPVRVRFKQLANGSQSIYLDIYKDGKREYEFLKLYLLPELNSKIKAQNSVTLAAAGKKNLCRCDKIRDLELKITLHYSGSL